MEKSQSEKLNTKSALKLHQNKKFISTIVNAYCLTLFNLEIEQNSTQELLIELLVQSLLNLKENNPIIYEYSYAILSMLYTEQAIKDLLVNKNLEFEKQLAKENTDLELKFFDCSLPWIINLNKYVAQSKTEKKAFSASEINQLYMQDLKIEMARNKNILLLFSIVPPQDSSRSQPIQFLVFLSLLFKQTKEQISKCIFWNIPNSYLKQEFILAMSQPTDEPSLDKYCIDAYSFISMTKIENKHSNEVSDLMKKTSFNTEKQKQLLDIIQASNTVREWTNNHTIIKVVEELSTQMNEHHSNHSLKQAHDQLTELLANIKQKNIDLHSYFHRILSQIYKDESLNRVELPIVPSDYKAKVDTELNMAKNYCAYSLMKIIGMSYKTNDTIQLSLLQSSAYIAYSNEIKRVLPKIHENLFLLFLDLQPQSFFDDFILYMPMMFFNDNIEEVLNRLPLDCRFCEFDKAFLKGITSPNNLLTLNTYYKDMQCLIQIHRLTDLNQIEQLLNKTSLKEEKKRKQLMEIMQQNKPNIEDSLTKLSKANIKLFNSKQEKKEERQRKIEEIVENKMEKIRQEFKEEIRKISSEKGKFPDGDKELLQQKYCIETRDQIIRLVDFFKENSKEIKKYSRANSSLMDHIEQKQCYEEFRNIRANLNRIKIDGNALAHPDVWDNFYDKLCFIHKNYKIPSLESIKILCNTPSFKNYFNITDPEQAQKNKPTFAKFYQEYKQCKEEMKQNIIQNK